MSEYPHDQTGGAGKYTVSATVLLATALFVSCLLISARAPEPPDFSAIPAGPERKTAFFGYLQPIIEAQNDQRRALRARLLKLRGEPWSKRDVIWLRQLADRYDLTGEFPSAALIDTLLQHVDTVPVSLALAQAAKESAWGTSRFAVEGYNYFGQRCHKGGCGMVPRARQAGQTFEVQRFESVPASVSSYLFNINRHPDYAGLRTYRAEQRRLSEPVSGIQAAERLTQYSERRRAYVDDIQSLIHFNKLDKRS